MDSVSSDLYPSETLEELVKARAARSIGYPILRDGDQRLAHALGALCTPHAFVFDEDLKLRYRGRIDDSFVPGKATQHYLRDAIRALLHGRDPPIRETTPLGCTIDRVRPKRDPGTPWWRHAHDLSITPNDHSHRG